MTIRAVLRCAMSGALVLTASAACKSQNVSEVRGLRLDEQNGDDEVKIDYEALLKDKQALEIAYVFAYEGGFYGQRGVDASADEGTVAAKTFVDYLTGRGSTELFNGAWKVETNEFTKGRIALGDVVRYAGVAPAIRITYPTADGDKQAVVDVRIKVTLLSVNEPGDPRLTLTREGLDAVVDGALNADAFVYSGHIWNRLDPRRPPKDEASYVDAGTAAIADKIRAAGGRKKPGVMYINACFSELTEKRTVPALGSGGFLPVWLAHRGMSNFGNFNWDSTVFLFDLLHAKPIARLVHDLTTPIHKKAGGAGANTDPMMGADPMGGQMGGMPQGAPTPLEDVSPEVAKARVLEYYKMLEQTGRLDHPHDGGANAPVIIVAYVKGKDSRPIGRQ